MDNSANKPLLEFMKVFEELFAHAVGFEPRITLYRHHDVAAWLGEAPDIVEGLIWAFQAELENFGALWMQDTNGTVVLLLSLDQVLLLSMQMETPRAMEAQRVLVNVLCQHPVALKMLERELREGRCSFSEFEYGA